jgi:hypothetical protein
MEEYSNNAGRRRSNENNVITGVVMITLGVLFLIDRYFPDIHFGDLWPFILIVVGILILFRGTRKS